MARIYSSQNQQSGYESKQQGVGFNPVQAYDESSKIIQRGQEKVQDIKTMSRMAATQFKMDEAYLNAEKQYGMGKLKLEAAADNHKFKVIQGLISLSSTAANELIRQSEAQQVRKDEDALLESIGWGEQAPTEAPEAVQQDTLREKAIDAEAKGVTAVATELEQENDLNSQSAAHVLKQTTTYNSLKGIEGNAYSAMGAHGLFLQEALLNLPEADRPKTAAQAQVLLRELNRQFLKQTGMMGSQDRKALVKLARTMSGNTQNSLVSLVSSAITADRKANLEEAKGFTSTLVDSGVGTEELWKKVTDRYAFGNVGYNGHSGESNLAALENILQEAAESGNTTLIEQMRKVQQVPGQKGTELEKKYDHIFDKYEKAARTGAVQEYNLRESEEKVALKQSIQTYYDNPSPENRQQAIATLRSIGSEEALKEATRLSQYGLGYDPQKRFELLEMRQAGQPIDQSMLKSLLDNGVINADEYKEFATTTATAQAQKQVDSAIKDIGAGLKTSMLGKAGPQDLTPEVRAQVEVRYPMLKEELRRRVMAEVALNPAIAEDQVELSRVIEAQTQYLLKQPQYQLTADPQKGFFFPGEIQRDRRLAQITVAPGVQDFSKIAPEDMFGKLKYPKSEMDASKDRFVPMELLKSDAKAILEGGKVSNRTRLIAKNLGMSPAALVEAQLTGVYGLPSLHSLRQQEGKANPEAANGLHDIKNANQGMQVLQQMGFPKLGAAYLAGNIQQESTWHGLRQWGQVAGDGTNRNGGLVSWASWSNDSARLGAIERHYGKNIAQISEGDQLKYMVLEMQRRNPSAYRVFMDPNASEAALRKASYQYWGYGHEGARFNYAKNLLTYGRV